MLKRKDILDPLAYLISLYKLRYFLNVNDINSVIEATKNYYGRVHYERISMTQKDEEEYALQMSKITQEIANANLAYEKLAETFDTDITSGVEPVLPILKKLLKH